MRQLVKIIDVHPGDKCRDGGQYGFYRLVPRNGGIVTYHTTSIIDGYCIKCGIWHQPDQKCWFRPKRMSRKQVENIITSNPTREAYDFEKDQGVVLVVDTTGHDPVLSEFGGCRVCYS